MTEPSGYQRIVDDVRAQVAAGTLRPGDPLPTYDELRAHYVCSVTVVRDAMLVLRSHGIVRGHRGGRVVVADDAPGRVVGTDMAAEAVEVARVHEAGWRALVTAVEQGLREIADAVRRSRPGNDES